MTTTPTKPALAAAGTVVFGPGTRATETALVLEEGLAVDAWLRVLGKVLRLHTSSAWWIGDVLAYGEWRYGTKYRETLERLELDYDRVRDYAYVAGNVPPAVRVPDLSWSHHRAVAKLVPAEQETWLARALAGDWSVRRLRGELDPPKQEPLPAAPESETAVQHRSSARLTLLLDESRAARYEAAAARAEASIEEWALAVLDAEAA